MRYVRPTLAALLCLLATACYAQHGSSSSSSSSSRSSSSSSRSGSGSGRTYLGEDDRRNLYFGLGALGAVVMGLIGFAARQTRVVGHLRIVATPPGEAPEEIRAAWVGLALPLRKNYSKPVALPTVGVLSQKQTEPAVGYAVLAAEALPLLTRHNPEAAAWWQKSAPHTRAPGYLLIFPIEVCETEAA